MPYITLVAESAEWAAADTASGPERAGRPASNTGDRSLIFVSHPHTHTLGGVQRQSNRLFDLLANHYTITRASRTAGIIPIASQLWQWRNRATVNAHSLVYCDDAVSAILGNRMFGGNGHQLIATVHGLDVIAPLSIYQSIVQKALQRLDAVVCVSHATARQVRARGVRADRIRVIPNVAEPASETIPKSESVFAELQQTLGIDLRNKEVLLSIGRPIKRKGFDLFIKTVFKQLPDNFVYIVAGPPINPPAWIETSIRFMSPERRRRILVAMGYYHVHEELKRLSDHPRVFYLNGVSERMRNLLYAVATQFIIPNRTIRGDMEGFGIVALEAAVRGVPIVAVGIEGIVDAIADGENGQIVAEGDSRAMIAAIRSLAAASEAERAAIGIRARSYTEKMFSLHRVGGMYLDLFTELSSGARA